MTNPRMLLISDFTIAGLVPYLAAGMTVVVAPYDQVTSVLLDGSSECWESSPDLAFVWTRPDAVVKNYARVLQGELVPVDDLLAEVDQFVEHLKGAAKRVANLFVAAWTLPPYYRGLGLLSLDPDVGHSYQLMRMNLRLAEGIRDEPGLYLLDAGRWVACTGIDACNPKLWYLGKMAFAPSVLSAAARDLTAAVRALGGRSRKMIVLDLDDTLWGGIVGDDGWQNLDLGGHSPVGEAYGAFQRGLKALQRRGILLGIVSKNTEAVALEAIDLHPEMVLRRDDFAGWRINWQDKVQNVLDLVAEINIGLDSVVVIDDSPVERARLKAALPEIHVPDWPTDKLLYARTLAELDCFDVKTLTQEDRLRSQMYVAERERRTAKESAQTVEEYRASLALCVKVEPLGKANLMRATQLLNKTNQMNLTTRRMTEAQLEACHTGDNVVLLFRVSDRFGDYGLTGLAILQRRDETLLITDFVLSCRVIGRGVEETILHVLMEHARRAEARRLEAIYLPTPRNSPVKRFFDKEWGPPSCETDERVPYTRDLAAPYPLPKHVQLEYGFGETGVP